jgi:hypothetical protein
MKLSFLLLLALMTSVASAKDLKALFQPLLSPDGVFEVYWLPEGSDKDVDGNSENYGSKILLRRRGDSHQGKLLRENTRWMAALWAPDSKLIAIEDHWDGHASEVYVYEAGIGKDQALWSREIFHTPENAYDLQWFIEDWEPNHVLHLRREQRTNDGIDVPASWKRHAPTEHVAFEIKS